MTRPIQFPSTLRPPQAPLSRLAPGLGSLARPAAGAAAKPAAPSMLDLLVQKAGEVNTMQQKADGMVHEMLTGGDVQSAEVLTAVQKADMAFRTMLQVRNKLIDAYREVIQMQV